MSMQTIEKILKAMVPNSTKVKGHVEALSYELKIYDQALRVTQLVMTDHRKKQVDHLI